MFWIIALLSAIFCGFMAGWLILIACNHSVNFAFRIVGWAWAIILVIGAFASFYQFWIELVSSIRMRLYRKKRTA